MGPRVKSRLIKIGGFCEAKEACLECCSSYEDDETGTVNQACSCMFFVFKSSFYE